MDIGMNPYRNKPTLADEHLTRTMMDRFPNPYRDDPTLADEHSSVLLAASTTATCIDDLLRCLFPHLPNTDDDAASLAWLVYEPTMLVELWDWDRTYQHDVRESGTGCERGEVVETVDVFVEAYRRFARPHHTERKQHERLCFFIDMALSSVLTLQQRISSVQSAYDNATCIIVTGRTGLVLQPLLTMDRVVVVHPNEMLSEDPEELPDRWLASVGTRTCRSRQPLPDKMPADEEHTHTPRLAVAWLGMSDLPPLTGTLDAQGLHFPSATTYPMLTDDAWEAAAQAIGVQIKPLQWE